MADAYAGRHGFSRVTHEGSLAQRSAAVVGAVFMLVGILGFIPGITKDYDDMGFAGPDSHAELFGAFDVSILHNAVHILFGLVGLALIGSHVAARAYLVFGGLLYLVLAVYGALVDETSDANFLPVNVADNWLHFALGAAMVLIGVVAWNDGRRVIRS